MGASVSTTKQILKDESLNAYRSTIVPEISNIKKQKRVEFCNAVRHKIGRNSYSVT